MPGRTLRIGRPQVDVVPPGPDLPDDGRTVVLYAPTWEGDRPSMSYGSAASHGPALVRALLADPRYRVVVRPHPRTGLVQAEVRAALTELRQLVRRANAADPSAQHLWDTGTPFGWHLAACDVCVTDISAVAYDWLATRKPLVVTEPVSAEAEVDRSGLIGTLDLLRAEDAGATASLVARLLSQGRDPALDAQAEHYYGDLTPGASMQRFLTAMAQVIERREAALARRDAAAPPAPTDDAPRSDETGTAPTPQGPDEP